MFLTFQVWAFLLLQESQHAVGWDVVSLWHQMGALARIVVVVLFLMSAWSIGVMIDRLIAYNAAQKQSRQFAPAVAGALREGKLDEAIKIADRYKKSHLAKVVVAGLQEFRAHQMSSDISGDEIDASKRALERAEAIVHAELKRGVGNLATQTTTLINKITMVLILFLGAGLVVNGKLYRGVNGAHTEIGHHIIAPSGPPCFCGGRASKPAGFRAGHLWRQRGVRGNSKLIFLSNKKTI